ncbi:MAG: cyanophycin synthetase [Polaribacter sp.]|jgi:cyanophycin synthetase
MTSLGLGSDLSSGLNPNLNTKLNLDDSRRLTGPNLFGPVTGAIIDVAIINFDIDKVISIWKKQIAFLLKSVNWETENILFRKYKNGASLVITAPIDVLYAATEINEAAWQLTISEIKKETSNNTNIEDIISHLIKEIEKEEHPKLLALQKAAIKHNVVFLSDDDEVSLGYGASCKIYPVNAIPDSKNIDWDSIKDIPVALVTGTNGKSTTVRLASAIIKAAGKICGITSTDYIRVGEKILDKGDYSGPGGARTLLRHPETEVAFLEVARGGMLRRGIGINHAKTALITNVSEDHLGEYGINDLDDMVEAKFIVRHAINNHQDLILNADDDGCINFAKQLDNTIVWFSWSKSNKIIQSQIDNKKSACYVENEIIYYTEKGIEQEIIHVNNIPITLNGAAKHNVHNALGVVALSFSLGIKVKDIRSGLKQFTSTPEDNPGRGNLFKINGFKVILDFAHNEQGLSLMAETVNNMPAKRRLVLLCQAGDRSDELIKGLVKSALKANPDVLVICELEDYLRGRKLGEMPKIIHKYAIELGMQEEQLLHAKNTIEGTRVALDWAENNDLILLLALDHRDEVIGMLKS